MILIVEEELLIAKDISNILQKEGYETHIGISNSGDVIKALSQKEYSLVLIHVEFKNNFDGVELGKYLLKRDTIPYIYITSYSGSFFIERIKHTRPHGVILKPYRAMDIITSVMIVLNNYRYRKVDALRSEPVLVDDVPFVLRNIINYIDENINTRLDIKDLSKLTCWSVQHFTSVFTQYLGETPYQYILTKKMEQAKVLVIVSNISLKDIAFELGYESYGNFCNMFKRFTGKKPSQYRKLHILIKNLSDIDNIN